MVLPENLFTCVVETEASANFVAGYKISLWVLCNWTCSFLDVMVDGIDIISYGLARGLLLPQGLPFGGSV